MTVESVKIIREQTTSLVENGAGSAVRVANADFCAVGAKAFLYSDSYEPVEVIVVGIANNQLALVGSDHQAVSTAKYLVADHATLLFPDQAVDTSTPPINTDLPVNVLHLNDTNHISSTDGEVWATDGDVMIQSGGIVRNVSELAPFSYVDDSITQFFGFGLYLDDKPIYFDSERLTSMYWDGTQVYLEGNLSVGSLTVRNAIITDNNNGLSYVSGATVAPMVAHTFDTGLSLTDPNSKILSAQNDGVEKASIDKDGNVVGASLQVNSGVSALFFTGLSTVELLSSISDGSSAVAAKINTNSSFVTAGAKLLSIQNKGVEKAYLDKDGNFATASSGYVLSGSGTFYGLSSIPSANGSSFTVRGRPNDGGTAVAVVLEALNTLSTSGAKIVSVRNNGTEKAFIDKDGSLNLSGFLYSASIYGTSGNPLQLFSQRADSSTVVGVTVDTTSAWSTAGAELLSIRNNGTEKAYFGKDGTLVIAGVASGSTAIAVPSGGRVDLLGGTNAAYLHWNGNRFEFVGGQLQIASGLIRVSQINPPGSATTLQMIGYANDGATAVANIICNQASLTTSGAKIVSFRPDTTTEKAYIGYDGAGWFAGNITAAGGIIAATTHQATTPVMLGQVADGSTSVGAVINTQNAFSIPGAKLLSIRNAGTEKAFIDKDGSLNLSANLNASNAYLSGGILTFNTGGASGATVRSAAADGATAVGVALDNTAPLTTAGAKLLSIRNAGTEKAWVAHDGLLTALNYVALGGTFMAAAGIGTQVRASIVDGASSIAHKFTNVNALSTAGAKIASFYSDNGVTEKASIDKDGVLSTSGNIASSAQVWGATGVYATNGVFKASGGNPIYVIGGQADSASAVGAVVDSGATFSTSGAKLLSVRNNTVDKFWVNHDGGAQFSGIAFFTQGLNCSNFGPYGAVTKLFTSAVNDGASAIGHKFNTGALTTTGAKLMSIQNNNVEKAYFDKDGGLVLSYVLNTPNAVQALHFSGANSGVVPKMLFTGADSATAVGCIVDTNNAFATSGAKLLSVRNAGSEKASIDKDGIYSGAAAKLTQVLNLANFTNATPQDNDIWIEDGVLKIRIAGVTKTVTLT